MRVTNPAVGLAVGTAVPKSKAAAAMQKVCHSGSIRPKYLPLMNSCSQTPELRAYSSKVAHTTNFLGRPAEGEIGSRGGEYSSGQCSFGSRFKEFLDPAAAFTAPVADLILPALPACTSLLGDALY